MEFFEEIENSGLLDNNSLKKLLTIARLPDLCSSIDSVISDEREKGIIYCIWGEFEINREELRDGIRFSFPKCPNALAWTITTDEESNSMTIHCTINKQEHDEEVIESIQTFVDDWSDGLTRILSNAASA